MINRRKSISIILILTMLLQVIMPIAISYAQIYSEKYTIEDGYIKAVQPGSTVRYLKQRIHTEEDIIIKKDDIVQEETNILATGMKAEIGEDTYTIIVKGDVNSDGNVSSTDLSKIRKHLSYSQTLEGNEELAVDINLDRKISATDLSQMRKLLAYKLDVTPPTKVTVDLGDYEQNTWTNKTVTQNFNATDEESGIGSYETYDFNETNGTWKRESNPSAITEDGIYRKKARAVDKEGNIGDASEEYIVKIDKTAPIITEMQSTSDLTSITTIITAQDNLSGIRGYKYSKDNGVTWTQEQTTETYTFNNLESGTEYKIKVIVIDQVGNERISEVLSISTVDDKQQISIYGEEYVKVGGQINYIAKYTTSGEIINTNIVWESENTDIATVDQSGNVTGIATGTTNIKATTSKGEIATKQITVTDLLGGTTYYLAPGETVTLTPTSYNAGEITWTTSNEINASLSASSGDSVIVTAGNTSGEYIVIATGANGGPSTVYTIIIDTIVPRESTATVISGQEGENSWYTSDVVVKITPGSDSGGSSIAGVAYRINGGDWQYSTGTEGIDVIIKDEGTNTIEHYTYDNANNKSSISTLTIKKDSVSPLDFIPTITDVTTEGFTINASTTDVTSGIYTYSYYIDDELKETTSQTSYVVTGCSSGRTYNISVIATDTAGNIKVGDTTATTTSAPSVEPVAKIGNTYYNSLSDAFDAVPTTNTKTTVTVISDIDSMTDTPYVSQGQNVLLELNDKNITMTSYSHIGVSGTLEVDGTGSMSLLESQELFDVYETGKLIISGGNFSSSSSTATYIYTITNDGEVIIQGGNITGKQISNNGTLTINDGTIEMTDTYAISNLQGSILNITGGTITNTGRYIVNSNSGSSITISGGNISLTATNTGAWNNSIIINKGGTNIITGGTITGINCSGISESYGTVRMSGGTLTTYDSYAITVTTGRLQISDTANITSSYINGTINVIGNGAIAAISGGTITNTGGGPSIVNNGGTVTVTGGTQSPAYTE